MKTAAGVDVVSQCQHDVYLVGIKLESLGAVLERQGSDCEGFTELAGFGYILSELSRKLERISRKLDDYCVSCRVNK